MLEITTEIKEQITKNIEQIMTYLMENALEGESIWVDYNYDNDFNRYMRTIRVSKTSVESGSLTGYHTTWRPLNEMITCNQIQIIEQWKVIKSDFNDKKEKIIREKNSTLNKIMNFTI